MTDSSNEGVGGSEMQENCLDNSKRKRGPNPELQAELMNNSHSADNNTDMMNLDSSALNTPTVAQTPP